MRKLAMATLAALTLSSPLSAAYDKPGMDEVRISYGDLNLSIPADVEKLEARIERKLREACKLDTVYTYGSARYDRACLAEGRAQAMAQVEAKQKRTLALN